jgi:hypothetical protein
VTNEAQAKAAFVVTRKLSRNGLMEAPEWLSKVPTKVNSLRAESPVSDRIDAPSVFVGSPRFSVDKRNWLEARVIVTTYNQHVRLLSPEPWLVGTIKVYPGLGADIVMESFHSMPNGQNVQSPASAS